MLNLKETTYKLYEPIFEHLAPVTQRKIRAAYDSRGSFLERMSILVYAANSIKAKKMGSSMDAAIFHMERQAKEMADMDPWKIMEAVQVVDKFNWMNTAYVRHKREHPEVEMPYVTFESCFWYMDALKLLRELNKEEYPLLSGWPEFFMFLPLSGELEVGRGGAVLKLIDYTYAVKDGKFHKWYQREKGYGERLSQFARGGFDDFYKEELQAMDDIELQEELLKGNWGHEIVKREIQRRKK
jgi:hypothetical protein